MLARTPLLALAACSFLAACDGTLPYDPAKSARPSRSAETSGKAQRPAMVEGALSGVCDPNAFACVGDNSLEYCGRNGNVQTSCDAICGSAGFSVSLGCGYDASFGGDACFCDTVQSTPSPSCDAGWSCADSGTLSYCGGGVLETWDCDAVCRDAGYDQAAACDWDNNGEGTCYCEDAWAPAACDYGDQACGDGTCVDSRYICDGYDDCGNGADEYGCSVCSFDGGICNGSNHVDTCDAYGIATWDCDEICAQSGYDFSEGCQYDSYSGTDSCFCNNYAACMPGELTCGDGSCLPNQYVCDGYVDCPGSTDEVGCVAECVPGEVYCTGDYTIEVCDDYGYWVDWDCDAVCQQSGYGYADSCGYDSFSGTDSCFCNY